MQEIVAIWYCHFAKLHNLVKYLSCRRHSSKICIENYHLLLKLVTKGDVDITCYSFLDDGDMAIAKVLRVQTLPSILKYSKTNIMKFFSLYGPPRTTY